MLASQIPTKFQVPWASSAGGSYITQPIPLTTVTPGRASIELGFPPTTFEQEASGGNPPFGADANGALYMISAWSWWLAAGGSVVGYDAAFSTANSGYPSGALLKSATAGHYWQSTADNNATNPDAGGANWAAFPDVLIQAQAGNWTATDSGSVNAAVITLWPQPASWSAIIGAPLRFLIGFTNTTVTPTLAIVGLPGTKLFKNTDGSNPVIGQLTAAGLVEGFYDGTNVQIACPAKPASSAATTSLQPGMILLCPNLIPFVGTLECDGSSQLISAYPNLYNSIGKRFGSVDGNHFNLPDMRGIFVRGWDHGRGLDPDAGSRSAPGVLAPARSGATGSAGDFVGTTQNYGVGGNIQLYNPKINFAASTWIEDSITPYSVGPVSFPISLAMDSSPYAPGDYNGNYPILPGSTWTYGTAHDKATSGVTTYGGQFPAGPTLTWNPTAMLVPQQGSAPTYVDTQPGELQSVGVSFISGTGSPGIGDTRPVNIDMMYVIVY